MRTCGGRVDPMMWGFNQNTLDLGAPVCRVVITPEKAKVAGRMKATWRYQMRGIPYLCLLLGALATASLFAQIKPEWKDVIGTWEGDSTCAVPSSPCHDEHNLYRVKPDKDDPDKLTVEGFKVEN